MTTSGCRTDPATRYRLDDEQNARVRNCLTKGRISLTHRRFERFVRDIEASIDHFRNAPVEGTFRDAHDGLRALWKRCHLDKPPVQVLRKELRKLPKRAVEHMSRRARVVIPRQFPGETIEEGVFDPPDRLAARFLAWASSAADQKLVTALRILSAEGGRSVAGRSRGGGERLRARSEPMIMGEVRGTGARDHRGGAPDNEAGHELVMHLALDWLHATGNVPKLGRSDHTGFGDLVHTVFQWVYGPKNPTAHDDEAERAVDEAAAYALRRYRDILKRREKWARPFAVPLICADCRWVQPGGSRDEFLCQRLGIRCDTARDDGQECGPEGLLFEQAV